MLFISSLLAATLIGIAQAQTPSGFTPNVNAKLDVVFNSTSVSTPGQLLTKGATATQPQIAISSSAIKTSNTYMFVMLDLDVPPAGGNSSRRVLLHAMNTGFKATSQSVRGINGSVLLASTDSGPAAYISPSPPASDTIAHRYVELLFQQPASLSVKASQFADTSARIGFDINSFMSQNGLSQPLAGNFFTVDGRASGAASGTATSSGGISRNTLQPFEGAAPKAGMDLSLGIVGMLAAMMVAA
ncbi:PEBP-like protein [Lophiostoma macrostomum CBS 122681]|uniref:PEBP-like protein n=1 Tax=Lophiostoma macrostomum CBS 122681 TaxID=1314788 RepID=A0A6A6TBX1_9PLEO|nr:PEBP-like protein [Lophiostoma macrostomum CBS 122681]